MLQVQQMQPESRFEYLVQIFFGMNYTRWAPTIVINWVISYTVTPISSVITPVTPFIRPFIGVKSLNL